MTFEQCAECWDGSGCAIRGACIIDEIVTAPTLRTATLAELHAEVERRKAELEAPLMTCDCGAEVVQPCDACHAKAHESHGETLEPIPTGDWLDGYDTPLPEAYSMAVSDPDALLVLNIAGMLLKRGVSIEDVCARLLTPLD